MIMIIATYTDLELEDIHNLSIVPDTHIINASMRLGMVTANAKPIDVENAWKPVLKELKMDPRVMHAALWHWDRLEGKMLY